MVENLNQTIGSLNLKEDLIQGTKYTNILSLVREDSKSIMDYFESKINNVNMYRTIFFILGTIRSIFDLLRSFCGEKHFLRIFFDLAEKKIRDLLFEKRVIFDKNQEIDELVYMEQDLKRLLSDLNQITGMLGGKYKTFFNLLAEYSTTMEVARSEEIERLIIDFLSELEPETMVNGNQIIWKCKDLDISWQMVNYICIEFHGTKRMLENFVKLVHLYKNILLEIKK